MIPAAPEKGPPQVSPILAMFIAPLFITKLYRDVARNWSGIGFGYLLLLELLFCAVFLVKMHLGFAGFVRNDFPKLVNDFPPITITNGHVSSPVKQPFFLKDPDTHRTFAVLDTTGKITTIDDSEGMLLLTENKLWTRQNDSAHQVKEYDLAGVKSFYLDKTKLGGWMETASHWLAIGLFPLLLIAGVIGRLLQMLIYGAINLALGSMMDAQLSFAAAMRLAIISVTPIFWLDMIFDFAHISIPYWGFVGILIALLYMAMAVRANSLPKAPLPGFPVGMPPTPGYPA